MTNHSEQFRVLLEASPIPLIISRVSDGKILYANKHLGDLVGMTPEELIGRETPDFYVDPADRTVVLDRLAKDGYLQDHEVRIKDRDGRVLWTVLSVVVSELDGESVIIGGLYDITERKRADEALENERNFVSAVLDTAGALVVVLDPQGRIVRFNRACELTTSYTFDEVKGKHFWDLFLISEEVGRVRALFEELRAGYFPNKGENYWVTKEGSRRLISWSNTAILDGENSVEYIIGTGIDITEQKQAEEALAESEERFRNIVENANDIIYSLTPDGIFTYVSPNWTHILGHDVSEAQGKSFTPFIHPDDLQSCLDFLQKVVDTGEKQSGIEYRVKHKDGSWRWHTSNASCLKDGDGNVISFIGIARDITDKKVASEELEKANQELRDTQSQLVQSEKMASLGNLMAGIAHEINTPVGAINSMHDTLVRAVDKLKETLETSFSDACSSRGIQTPLKVIGDANRVISNGMERVMGIVRSLRSFARLDEAELKEVDLHEGIDNTLTLVHHDVKNRIEVVKNYGDVPPIVCYPSRLNQVFLNLLVNASQAIEGEGEISISTFVKDEKTHVVIKDTGVGISEKNQQKIFDPGFTTKGVGVGTGLGLSICYQIVQDHKGKIQVESEVGKGTIFTVILPMDLDEGS